MTELRYHPQPCFSRGNALCNPCIEGPYNSPLWMSAAASSAGLSFKSTLCYEGVQARSRVWKCILTRCALEYALGLDMCRQ